MAYAVKEIFYTLQGEGANTGHAAVLCRFAGCNLWSGVESKRHSAVCQFCDTDFVGTDGPGGGKFATAQDLAQVIATTWRGEGKHRFVVFTGGEPSLQLDQKLVEAVKCLGFRTAIETNGTLPVCGGLDWICVSPKRGAPLRQRTGDELKLIFPQEGLSPEAVEQLDFEHFYLQPCDGPSTESNTRVAIEYCLAHPRWRLSTQTHKTLRIS